MIDYPVSFVGLPIGNREDITRRALAVLAGVDCICCEDTRNTGMLLAHYEIKKPLLSLHEHNDAVRAPEVQGAAMAALRSRWDELRAGLGVNLDAIRAGVEDAGRSVGDWLEGHRADIDAVAQQAGAGLGEIVNGLNGALASVFG